MNDAAGECDDVVHPQMAAALAKQAELVPGQCEDAELSVAEARRLYEIDRRYWNADGPPLERVLDTHAPGPAGDVGLRLFYPSTARPLPLLVYVHGGGWILGSLDTHDKIMRLLAIGAGIVACGVDYSLSPERKFPVAVDEVCAAIGHLRRESEALGVDRSRIVLAGDSAGANLAVAACLSLHEADLRAVRALTLFYGYFGLRDSASRRRFSGTAYGLTNADMDYYLDCYTRGPEDRDDPRIDVLGANLRKLPSTHIAAAALDPLRDDSLALHARLREHEVESRLVVYEGVLHGFLHLSRMVDRAKEAIDDAARHVRRAIGAGQPLAGEKM